MKNLILILGFLFVGGFAFGQSGCSCESGGNSCSASCGAGSIASCSGAGGFCGCSCEPAGEGIESNEPKSISAASFAYKDMDKKSHSHSNIFTTIKYCGVNSPESIAKIYAKDRYEIKLKKNGIILTDYHKIKEQAIKFAKS